jgi:hypothetical protein
MNTAWRSVDCKICGNEFGAKKTQAFYCSNRCRNKAELIQKHFREQDKADANLVAPV